MTLHEAIKNSKGISKLTNLVGGKEELVINATEAIINKNMKGLTKDQKEKCINDKTYIENQIVGIIEGLKNGSTVYSKVYERTTRFEGTADMYEKVLEAEEKFEEKRKAKKEFLEDIERRNNKINEEVDEINERVKEINEETEEIKNKNKKLNERFEKNTKRINELFEEAEKIFENDKKVNERIDEIDKEVDDYINKLNNMDNEEPMKDKKKKGFLDYVTAPFKYIGKKIAEAATFIGEKISNGFNKLKGLFGKKETKETVK